MQFTPTSVDEQRLDQLARYLAYGIPQVQAAQAVGFTAARVSQLLQEEAFVERVQMCSQEIATLHADTNMMYDRIEKKALENLWNTAQYRQDPDLNMRLAMMANRATRRGADLAGPRNVPLDATGAESLIEITLTTRMVRTVQSGHRFQPQTIEARASETNIATPQTVERLVKGELQERPAEAIEVSSLAAFFAPLDAA